MSFDQYAQNWDTEKRINRARIIASEIEKSIQFDRALTAMEFGCGTGLVSFNLHNKFHKITLLDSSKGMIDVLDSKIKKFEIENMYVIQSDIAMELDQYDVIYNSMVLHHIRNTEEILKKFHELLNHDGYLIIVDLNKEDGRFHKAYPEFDGHNGFDQKELRNLLVQVGFQEVESKTIFSDTKSIEKEPMDYSLFLLKGRKI